MSTDNHRHFLVVLPQQQVVHNPAFIFTQKLVPRKYAAYFSCGENKIILMNFYRSRKKSYFFSQKRFLFDKLPFNNIKNIFVKTINAHGGVRQSFFTFKGPLNYTPGKLVGIGAKEFGEEIKTK